MEEVTSNINVPETKTVGSNLGETMAVPSAVEALNAAIFATPIDNPDAAYLAATTKIDFSDLPDGSSTDVISDDTVFVAFSQPLVKLGPVPDGWSTWSSPPFSEDPNPFVLSSPVSTLTLEISRPVSIFGFELEPSPFGDFEFTADFYRGDTLVESITRVVNGDGGARLFAREDGAIDRVVITGIVPFAIAQVRYQLAPIDPALAAVLIALIIVILALILL
ncbi:MAG: hypothetical protein QM432_08070 [Bacillota bacterium]|jgi:hypothetical protein|nr:hypothetical protein [Bacillota bacterium]